MGNWVTKSVYGYQRRYKKFCWHPSLSHSLFIIWIWCCSHKDAGAFMRIWRWCTARRAPLRRTLNHPRAPVLPALWLTLWFYKPIKDEVNMLMSHLERSLQWELQRMKIKSLCVIHHKYNICRSSGTRNLNVIMRVLCLISSCNTKTSIRLLREWQQIVVNSHLSL